MVAVIIVVFVVFFLFHQIEAIRNGDSISIFAPTSFSSVTPLSSTNNISNTVVKKISIDDPDLNGLNSTLETIRQAILDNNVSFLNKYYSQPTLAAYASSGGGRIIKTYLRDVTFSNIRKLSSTKVFVTITQVEMSGHSDSQDVLFVREPDGWKMGVVETKSYFGN